MCSAPALYSFFSVLFLLGWRDEEQDKARHLDVHKYSRQGWEEQRFENVLSSYGVSARTKHTDIENQIINGIEYCWSAESLISWAFFSPY